ncbi:MAG: nitroreductase family protein [Bacteroidales bacterium]|jgi:nitroreductase|nr:nitroreductase family protein [Bacteroidales bacterium]
MHKEAKTNGNEIHPLLKKRWSPRAFAEKPVEEQKLKNILEAARWSPSASNLQPWVFIIGMKGGKTYEKIFSTLVEFNQLWTKLAPVLILNCGRIAGEDGKPFSTWQYDTGQAVAHLSVQAMAEGLHVHQMSGFDALKAAELFSLPDNVRAVSVTAIGYIGDPSLLHPRMRKSEVAERERKEMATFVFSEIFGNPSDIVK